jgi:hypothetical protein
MRGIGGRAGSGRKQGLGCTGDSVRGQAALLRVGEDSSGGGGGLVSDGPGAPAGYGGPLGDDAPGSLLEEKRVAPG